jgi:multisubunit Na+/H+ antiporter MnhB subunit
VSVEFANGLIALCLVVAGAWTVIARDLLAATVAFVVLGLMLALGWSWLGAVDVAIAEAAIGGGLTGLLLLGAAARLLGTEAEPRAAGPGALLRATTWAACIGVAALVLVALHALPEPPATAAPQAVAALPATGLGNPVTGVLMAFRALDTMLEKVVVVLAVVAVWSLAPDAAWGDRPRIEPAAAGDGLAALLARLLVPLGVIVGVYLLWIGADAPGGAFQGATILAAMWLLAMLAGLAEPPRIGAFWLRAVLVAGAAAFLIVGLVGIGIADAFLAYPEAIAKPLIIGVEILMTLSVAAALAMLVAGPPGRPR